MIEKNGKKKIKNARKVEKKSEKLKKIKIFFLSSVHRISNSLRLSLKKKKFVV